MSRKGETNNLLNYVMCVSKAALEGLCEDAYAFNVQNDYGMISVFDGCGGLGARKYAVYDDHTAAYIAARIASDTVLNWFERKMSCDQNGMYASTKQIASGLKSTLDEKFLEARHILDTDEIKLTGSLIRSFPTTASIALIDSNRDSELRCTFLWAGDSRGYILQPDGLKQCTVDDLRTEEDAFDNLYADAPLSNMLNGEGKYSINQRKITCRMPAIIFVATDGVFGYLNSPMHFEWMLIKTLCDSRSFREWETKLCDEISLVTGDDSTLIMAVYGWESFSDLQDAFKERERGLRELLSQRLSMDKLREAWQMYKGGYMLAPKNESMAK